MWESISSFLFSYWQPSDLTPAALRGLLDDCVCLLGFLVKPQHKQVAVTMSVKPIWHCAFVTADHSTYNLLSYWGNESQSLYSRSNVLLCVWKSPHSQSPTIQQGPTSEAFFVLLLWFYFENMASGVQKNTLIKLLLHSFQNNEPPFVQNLSHPSRAM